MRAVGTGIWCIDTGLYRPSMVACYLVEHEGAVAFVDTGTHYAVDVLLDALRERGYSAENVLYVIPTHAHLDHGGGAGELLQRCPNARLVAHPKAAIHFLDPSKIIAGATAVYGEEAFKRDFGTLIPADPERLIEATDELEVDLNGRRLTFLDTPGHANHHCCIFDHLSRGFFTGDTFGISYREFDGPKGPYLFAPSTPVAFDPEAWEASIDRLMRFDPRAAYLTHFGKIEDLEKRARELRESVRRLAEIAKQEAKPVEGREARIRAKVEELLVSGAMATGCGLSEERCRELLAVDTELNAQGLEVWLVRRERRAG